jgi:Na+/proline symporter/ribosomal protein L25 (general stress protein Ctc)
VPARGSAPAVLYGSGGSSVAVAVDPKEVNRILRSKSGPNTIFDVSVTNGETTPAMIVDWQHDPVKSNLLHVDLKRIDLTQRIRVAVPVHTLGDPQGVKLQGGLHEVIASGQAAGKFAFINLSFDRHTAYTLWAGILGGVSLTLATHGTDQYLVQRLLSARSSRDAGLGLVLSGVVVFAQFTLFLFIGVMLFTYYQHVPLPPLGRSDELLPRFIINTLHGGVAGFVVAAIVAAALSPSLNAMAATTVNDFYKRYVRVEPDEASLMRISRIATIGWGIAQIGVALLCQRMDRGVLDAGLSVLSLTSGPVLGAFLVGVLSRRAAPGPMLTGMIAGIIVLMAVWWYDATAWPWYAFIGVVVTSSIALAGSWMRGKRN